MLKLIDSMSTDQFMTQFYDKELNVYNIDAMLRLYGLKVGDSFTAEYKGLSEKIIIKLDYILIDISNDSHSIILTSIKDDNIIEVEPQWFFYRGIGKSDEELKPFEVIK